MLGEIEISPFFYIFDFMEGIFKKTVIAEKFKKLKEINQIKIWIDSLDRDTQEVILNLIKYNQLTGKGINEFGEIIGRYSPLTEEINPEKVAGTPYTLKDSGEFYNSMTVTPMADGFLVDADDVKTGYARSGNEIIQKTTKLFDLYGDSIVGLTEESKEELRKYILIKLIENVKKAL